jgi:hypothetical protein
MKVSNAEESLWTDLVCNSYEVQDTRPLCHEPLFLTNLCSQGSLNFGIQEMV